MATTEKTFADRLRSLRTKAGMTQQQLSNAAGLSISTISQMEAGANEPKYSTIQALASALGVGVGRLFGEPK